MSTQLPAISQQLSAIKADLRSAMNGVTAARIRESGMDYHLVFGVEYPRLQSIAAEFTPDRHLAQALWQENVRESRILATLLMPVEDFFPELADLWAESIKPSQAELAGYLVANLLCRTSYASDKAFVWMAADEPIPQLLGFLLITRLLRQGMQLSPDAEAEFLDQAEASLKSPFTPLQKAVQNALLAYNPEYIFK
ncbi:MAG: DNA alkylation repair protein [Bacteroidaceae bacterium]|nr:DNA alkylation repair protein [Bacteroidaceae bacterium]